MKYKVRDKVRIKTAEEFNGLFPDIDNICHIPLGRVVTIYEILENSDFVFIGSNNCQNFGNFIMIKCHANEYYLQQIKEEL